jgi:uncharacterized protein with NAD-binding domain and iron-sulfur cluster
VTTAERPQRVAILGGGAAALTAALALTDPRNPTRYQVTVYQMGWRLGGKGASGRNRDRAQRIEEHGIHVWFGFYDNAFRLLSSCFDEIAATRDPGEKPWALPKCLGAQPPPGDDGAFYPQDDYFLHELHAGEWKRWHVKAPRNGRTPGDGSPLKPEESFGFKKLREMLEAVAELRKRGVLGPASADGLESAEDPEEQKFGRKLRGWYGGDESTNVPLGPEHFLDGALDAMADPGLPERLLDGDESLGDEESRFRLRVRFLAWTLRRTRNALRAACRLSSSEPLRRIYYTVDTSAAMVSGIYEDVIRPRLTSFDHLDTVDLRTWLASHGAAEGGRDGDMLMQNPTVRFVYNSAFSFVDGDHHRPSIAAGAALRGILRLFLTYKGSCAYRMSSGMGDVVFSPMYEVLRRRGVTFEFFHRVDRLQIADGPAGPEVRAIHLGKQVRLQDGSRGYDPFVWVKGFPAWPDRPLYPQIEGGEELERAVADGLHLEDPSARWRDEEAVELRAGEHFDGVILGIPVAALGTLAGELVAHPKVGVAWTRMLTGVRTTPTQAFQVWFRGSLRDLGWEEAAPVTGTYLDPIDTYIDMTPALEREERRADDVKSLAYFCGVMKAVEGETPGHSLTRAIENATIHLVEHGSRLFPRLGAGAAFDWNMLSDGEGVATVRARMAGQYVRANVLPSERYTLGLPGSTDARLAPGGSGVGNLFLAGDWTRNPINLGCVEATVMSGLQAARALSGEPIEITGEHDTYLWASLGRGAGPVGALESLQGGAGRWDGGALDRLRVAAEDNDPTQTAALCDVLIRHLDASDEPFGEADGVAVLDLLQRHRLFALMGRVADALRRRGLDSAGIRRRHAQALIEEKSYTQALDILRSIQAEDEMDEALGLTGRVYKQIYVDTTAQASNRTRQTLIDAVAAYRRGYERAPGKNTWHGVNLVALLQRAARDGVAIPFADLDATALAHTLIETIGRRALADVEPWTYAILAEAYVARGDLAAALKAVRHYVVDASAFGLGSFLRQMKMVWQIDRLGQPGRQLITLLEAYLLEAEGGRLDLDGATLQRALDDARGLQKVFGNEQPVTLTWYLQGLERCRLVARVDDGGDVPAGTGFLVRAADFLPLPPDPEELLLLTNAHVLGDTAISPAVARAVFKYPHPALVEPSYRIRQVLKTSPKDQLDYTLAALSPAVHGAAAFPLASGPPLISDQRSGERLYVIGHPEGGELSLSMYDNQLVDLDDRLLHYHAPTKPGSSGSAVMNRAWELVGLHHAGGHLRRLRGAGSYAVNEGIRIDAIRADCRH